MLSVAASGKIQGGGDLTEAFLRLFGAWAELTSRDTVAMAYLLLLEGEFACRGDVYSLTLDQAAMEGVAYTIAPEVWVCS